MPPTGLGVGTRCVDVAIFTTGAEALAGDATDAALEDTLAGEDGVGEEFAGVLG